MFSIANSVQDSLNNNVKSCRLALNTSGEKLEVNIRTLIFQVDSLSPFLYGSTDMVVEKSKGWLQRGQQGIQIESLVVYG